MEPMTGFALLQEMRSDPSLAEIPLIMITAESKRERDSGEKSRRI
jgi:two-component system, chemotaxis family, chemotaxis protein CheY